MSEDELYNKALRAGQNHYAIYGKYPEKIGIHWQRINRFYQKYPCIVFLSPTRNVPMLVEPESLAIQTPTFEQHTTTIGVVQGHFISPDDVYLPTPDGHIISGAQLAQMTQEEQGEFCSVPPLSVLQRMQLAERKVEVDVCPKCYQVYMSFHRLSVIYDSWFAPQCDYCGRTSKYHIKRGDTVWSYFEQLKAEQA
jgi:hypothetical protein